MPVAMNTRLALEAPERIADGLSGYRTDWRQLGWLWVRMDARSGREQGTGAGMVSVVQWRITTRAAPVGDPRRPRPGQRFRLGERLFNIEAVAESDAGGRLVDCFAREEDLT
ncbi:head-tail adaptor protein [Paracoccus rhizosphaerae]|uniref:Head-tail adaptor protein n=1 Tax=Paracoccus rhizosphaerae TaxID=1133347 RepID=A0ABV6CLX0_9RHOB|nr:head-tail adaptor protein [Paracoccus rhizosphaerae]